MTRTALAALALMLCAPAALAAGGYDSLKLTEPASAGLEVQPPLEEFRATSAARLAVPENWTRVRGRGARFLTPGATCRFRVSWTVRSRVADASETAAQRLDAALAAPPRAHVYEEGMRNGRPWRVVKITGSSISHMRGGWVGVLTRRRDVVPDGKAVWTEIIADARARSSDECHSGTIHNTARDIADGLAVAASRLRLVRG